MASIESVTLEAADPTTASGRGSTGSHRIMCGGDIESFTGPDGVAWETAQP